MPDRPRNLITDRVDGKLKARVSVRWTEAHHITYLRLGGSKWLRAEIEKHMEKKR